MHGRALASVVVVPEAAHPPAALVGRTAMHGRRPSADCARALRGGQIWAVARHGRFRAAVILCCVVARTFGWSDQRAAELAPSLILPPAERSPRARLHGYLRGARVHSPARIGCMHHARAKCTHARARTRHIVHNMPVVAHTDTCRDAPMHTHSHAHYQRSAVVLRRQRRFGPPQKAAPLEYPVSTAECPYVLTVPHPATEVSAAVTLDSSSGVGRWSIAHRATSGIQPQAPYFYRRERTCLAHCSVHPLVLSHPFGPPPGRPRPTRTVAQNKPVFKVAQPMHPSHSREPQCRSPIRFYVASEGLVSNRQSSRHAAPCCNPLFCVAARCLALQPAVPCCNTLSCVATCCPALQHVAFHVSSERFVPDRQSSFCDTPPTARG
jgi:hypothetical protein